MGDVDTVGVDETVERAGAGQPGAFISASARRQLIVVAFAAAIFVGCLISPPSLMDDVDAVQGKIARNMLQSGDWVTARLDGVPYLEKGAPWYWEMAAAYA